MECPNSDNLMIMGLKPHPSLTSDSKFGENKVSPSPQRTSAFFPKYK